MRNKLKLNKKGFTIIEVMIVLAIAGLILLIVFIAVPTLTRDQHNTGRKEDAGRLVTAWGDFVSNSGGQLPTSGNWSTDCQAIINDAGNLNQGQVPSKTGSGTSATTINTFTCKTGSPSSSTSVDGLYLVNGAQTITITPTSGFMAIFDTGATCNGSTSTNASSNSNDTALFYDLETGSGSYNWACITAN